MKRFLIGSMSALLLITGSVLISATPSSAQFTNVKQHLQSLPTNRVLFARGTSSKNINGAEDRIYIVKARKGQRLTLNVSNLGARASVTLYGTNGKVMSPIFTGYNIDDGKIFSVKLPATGDYYIVAGGGPTFHVYNFTVSIK
jgi:hypothetical protein